MNAYAAMLLLIVVPAAMVVWYMLKANYLDRELSNIERIKAMEKGVQYNVMGVQHVKALGTIGAIATLVSGIGAATSFTAIGAIRHPLLAIACLLAVLISFFGLNTYVFVTINTKLNRINPNPRDPLNRHGVVHTASAY